MGFSCQRSLFFKALLAILGILRDHRCDEEFLVCLCFLEQQLYVYVTLRFLKHYQIYVQEIDS